MHAASLLELKGEDDIKRGQPLFGLTLIGLPPFGLNLIRLTPFGLGLPPIGHVGLFVH